MLRGVQMANAARGAALFATYSNLKHKKDRNDFEEQAFLQFRKYLRTILTIICIEMVICSVIVINFISSFGDGYYHPGKYENGMIRYINNDILYVSPSEVGLSESELTEGDEIDVYTDRYDNIISAVRQEDASAKQFNLLYMMFAWLIQFVIVIVGYGQYIHKHYKYMGAYLRGETSV